MSHKATHWLATIDPGDMTHGEFRVLFHLCDCHNPSQGCFPMQEYLRGKTGLSNGGLNKALKELEEKRLIRREKTYDVAKKKRGATHYILGCDEDLAQALTPLSGDSPNSTQDADLTPLNAQTYLHQSGVSLKEEPVKEPVKEPCAAVAPQSDFDFSAFLAEFQAAYPRLGDLEKTEDALRAAIDAGAEPSRILAGVRAYADEQKGNEPRYIAYSENWIAAKRWERHATPSANGNGSNVEVIREQRAKAIREGQSWVASSVSPSAAREMIALELVTAEQCKAVGVDL